LELEDDVIDMQDIDQAYEAGADDDVNRTEENQSSAEQPATGGQV
jgi:hypothetical protein